VWLYRKPAEHMADYEAALKLSAIHPERTHATSGDGEA
jgi:hypothetical protein